MTHILKELHKLFNESKRFHFPFESERNLIPKNGIYVMFEKGEKYCGYDRIVRVGTHTGDNQLYSRLNQHFLNENKNRSIFRKHLGRCFINRNNKSYLRIWNLGFTTREEKKKNNRIIDFEYERKLEKQISEYIQKKLSFAVFEVNEKNKRLFWESRIASTLAQGVDNKPSRKWFGHKSPVDKIKESGLWQVQGLKKETLTNEELKELKILVKK